jgi:glutathione S-transferase
VTIKLETVRLAKSLAVVEQALAARDYLLAGGFSAADIAMGYTVAISEAFRPLAGEPRLQAYVARLKARPAVGDLLELPRPAA